MDLLTQLRRAYEIIRMNSASFSNYDPVLDEPLMTHRPSDEYEEIDRYWVNAPYSFISVLENTAENQLLYQVREPPLSEFEAELLDNVREDVRDRLIYVESDADADSMDVLIENITTIINQYGLQIDRSTFHKLLYHIHRRFSGYGRIAPIMNDPHVEDISCVGHERPIFVYHDDYNDIKTNVTFTEANLDNLIIRLGQMAGRELSVGNPISNATLPDGSRAELVYTDEVSSHGSAFTIRKYSEETMSPVDLITYNTFTIEQMAYFWLAIEHNMNLIFAGGTASGKTTSLNAVSMFLPPNSKVITIEDTREISLYHDNWLANVTRDRSTDAESIDMFRLLRSALRHRPEYIIVGEIRGEEATTLFQAMNTGHTTYSTMHADSMQTVINRLENNPINIPRAMIESLDILSVQNLTRIDDERARRSDAIIEVKGIDQRTGELNYSTLYNWNPTDDTFTGSQTESDVLERIGEKLGWSQGELLREFRNRERVLSYLVQNDISEYDRFTSVIKKYATDPQEVLDWIDDPSDQHANQITSV